MLNVGSWSVVVGVHAARVVCVRPVAGVLYADTCSAVALACTKKASVIVQVSQTRAGQTVLGEIVLMSRLCHRAVAVDRLCSCCRSCPCTDPGRRQVCTLTQSSLNDFIVLARC